MLKGKVHDFAGNMKISGFLTVKAKANSTRSKAKNEQNGKNNIPGGCLPGMRLCVEACHGFRENGQGLRASHLGSFFEATAVCFVVYVAELCVLEILLLWPRPSGMSRKRC